MREAYKKYFSNRFESHGEDVRTLWGNQKAQQDRFAALCKIGELNGKRVLDVGCGFGDFFAYLSANRLDPSQYVGIDCVEKFISVARVRYPGARFSSSDLTEFPENEIFDYVFASGIFFLNSPAWEEYTLDVLGAMFLRAQVGVAANFLSCFSTNREPGSRYLNPGEFLSLVMSRVTVIANLSHSYRSNDFTIFLYKNWQDGSSL